MGRPWEQPDFGGLPSCMARQLSEKDLQALRQRGLLDDQETAFKDGSVVVAENLITKARRIIDVAGLMLETNQQLLHD